MSAIARSCGRENSVPFLRWSSAALAVGLGLRDPGDVIADPILPAPDLPKKILASRQPAKLQARGAVAARDNCRMAEVAGIGWP